VSSGRRHGMLFASGRNVSRLSGRWWWPACRSDEECPRNRPGGQSQTTRPSAFEAVPAAPESESHDLIVPYRLERSTDFSFSDRIADFSAPRTPSGSVVALPPGKVLERRWLGWTRGSRGPAGVPYSVSAFRQIIVAEYSGCPLSL
jgi:hypothetical protein